MVIFFRLKELKNKQRNSFLCRFPQTLSVYTDQFRQADFLRPSTVCYLPFGELRHIMTYHDIS